MTNKIHTLSAIILVSLSLVACTDEGADRDAIGGETDVYKKERVDPPLEAVTEKTPSMPKAEYETVQFVEGYSDLTPDAKETLDQVAEELSGEGPVLLTLRMQDDDTIDATEPTEQFKILTPERVTAVKKYLQENGVEVERVAIDEAGAVADVGEDAAMARAPERDDARHVVIQIEEKRSREPSDTIPH